MAQKTVLVDDLDGGEAAETVTFALDGSSYEIDLNEHNATRLRGELSTWIGHARLMNEAKRAVRAVAAGGRRPAGKNENAAIRAWAREQGRSVSERGRIPSDIVEAYHAAH